MKLVLAPIVEVEGSTVEVGVVDLGGKGSEDIELIRSLSILKGHSDSSITA
jgi:hypothetical protein